MFVFSKFEQQFPLSTSSPVRQTNRKMDGPLGLQVKGTSASQLAIKLHFNSPSDACFCALRTDNTSMNARDYRRIKNSARKQRRVYSTTRQLEPVEE
jgi:hypothetical protein